MKTSLKDGENMRRDLRCGQQGSLVERGRTGSLAKCGIVSRERHLQRVTDECKCFAAKLRFGGKHLYFSPCAACLLGKGF